MYEGISCGASHAVAVRWNNLSLDSGTSAARQWCSSLVFSRSCAGLPCAADFGRCDSGFSSLVWHKHVQEGQTCCRPVLQVSASSQAVDSSLGAYFGELASRKDRVDGIQRTSNVDVVTLGNLCVDIVLKVPQLPMPSSKEKYSFVQHLSASPPDESFWEGGGNCNFAIAAARLGLQCVALGHLGEEKFGHFLSRVLQKEGVGVVGIQDEHAGLLGEDYDGNTLICWVLVDPQRRHAFCSRYDYNQTPVFNKLSGLPSPADRLIQQSKALFCNGFVYDELAPQVILDIVERARESGCSIFFDPGPRVKSLAQGTGDQRQSLDRLLSISDVILLTDDEAEALTKISEPRSAARALIEKSSHTKWVVVKLGARGCLLATAEGTVELPGFEVEVKDTVGCGDSFAAAIVLGYIHGLPVTTTLALANAVGAATAMGRGAGRNVASSSTVLQILSRSSVCCEQDAEMQSVSCQIALSAAAKNAWKVLQKMLEGRSLE